MRRISPIAALLLALFGGISGGLASPVMAQSKLKPPKLDEYLRWGPLRVRPGFSVENFGYDDNILLENENPIADYRATLAPRVDGLLLMGRRAFLTFEAEGGYTAFAETTEQNFFDRGLSSRVTVPFGRVGVFFEGRYLLANQQPADLEDVRPERTENTLGGGVILALGWRSEVELRYRNTTYRYDDPDFNSAIPFLLARDEDRFTAGVDYKLFGRTKLTFDLDQRTSDFLNFFESDGELLTRDSDELNLWVGMQLASGGPLSGRARFGRANVDFTDPAIEDIDTAIGDIQLRYRLAGRSYLEAEGERRTQFSVFQDNAFLIRSDLSLRWVQYFNRLIGVEVGVGRGSLEFPGDSPREDNVDQVTLGVRLRGLENGIGQKTEYALRVRRSDRDSTVDILDRSQTTVTLDAVFGF